MKFFDHHDREACVICLEEIVIVEDEATLTRIESRLRHIEHELADLLGPRFRGLIIFGPPQPSTGSVQGGVTIVSATKADIQKIQATAAFTDAAQQPVTPATCTWATDNGTISPGTLAPDGTVTPPTDPAAVTLDAVLVSGTPGIANVTATADDGTVLTGAVTITAGPAAGGAISFGSAV